MLQVVLLREMLQVVLPRETLQVVLLQGGRALSAAIANVEERAPATAKDKCCRIGRPFFSEAGEGAI